MFTELNIPQDLTRRWILRLNKFGREKMFGKIANKKLFYFFSLSSEMRSPIFVLLRHDYGPFVHSNLNIFSPVGKLGHLVISIFFTLEIMQFLKTF